MPPRDSAQFHACTNGLRSRALPHASLRPQPTAARARQSRTARRGAVPWRSRVAVPGRLLQRRIVRTQQRLRHRFGAPAHCAAPRPHPCRLPARLQAPISAPHQRPAATATARAIMIMLSRCVPATKCKSPASPGALIRTHTGLSQPCSARSQDSSAAPSRDSTNAYRLPRNMIHAPPPRRTQKRGYPSAPSGPLQIAQSSAPGPRTTMPSKRRISSACARQSTTSRSVPNPPRPRLPSPAPALSHPMVDAGTDIPPPQWAARISSPDQPAVSEHQAFPSPQRPPAPSLRPRWKRSSRHRPPPPQPAAPPRRSLGASARAPPSQRSRPSARSRAPSHRGHASPPAPPQRPGDAPRAAPRPAPATPPSAQPARRPPIRCVPAPKKNTAKSSALHRVRRAIASCAAVADFRAACRAAVRADFVVSEAAMTPP
jgi:hypothetical protein